MLLVLNEKVNAVESYTSIVADDTASAVSVGETCEYSRMTCKSHLGSVCVENALIVSFSVLGEYLNYLGIDLIAVLFASLLSHTDSAEGL